MASNKEEKFGDAVEATRKNTKKRGVIKSSPRGGEKQYRVDLTYTYWGKFYVDAVNTDEARELVEKYGSQTDQR